MAEGATLNRWAWRALFVALAALIMLLRLLPLDPGPVRVPWPDMLIVITFAWVLRRPDHVPVLVVAGLFLLADVLFLRPLGLGAALAVLATEFLRARHGTWRDQPFALEWATVAAVLASLSLANAAVLAILVVDQPALGATLLHLILTVLAYPLAAGLVRVLGIRYAAPGEVDASGLRP